MQLSFSKTNLDNRLETLEGLVDPVPFFHETNRWTQIRADEQGFSKSYFERVLEVVQENVQIWLSLDFEEAENRLQEKRTSSLKDKQAELESLKSINEEYGELRKLLLNEESFDEMTFSSKLENFVGKIHSFSKFSRCNYGELIDNLGVWKKNREDKNQDLSELPVAVPGHDKIEFLSVVEDIDSDEFGSIFNDTYQKIREGESDALKKLKDLFSKVELHIAKGEFKEGCPELLENIKNWERKRLAESAVLVDLPEKLPDFDNKLASAFEFLSHEEGMEFVFEEEERLEQCFETLASRYTDGELDEGAMRVLDLHRLFSSIFRNQETVRNETSGKEICLSLNSENLVKPSHPYYQIADENKVLIAGVDAVAKTILNRKDLISTVASPLSDCKLWSKRAISPIADCWKSGGGVIQRLLSTIKMIVQVYIQFPAALNFWKNKANGCEDHEVKGELELFAKGYGEFSSLDKKFCWITQAAGKQEGINVSMHRVLQEILDPQKKAFDIDDFKILAGSDYVTFEEMDKMRKWVAQNVNPVNEAMGELQDFFVNATEYTLGLIPKTQKAPLGEFKEKARAVYDACKTFEEGFAKAFPELSQA
ncbi:MAG: hypothetical protein ChlgKO_07420 [Chlamydiales bacterium]